MVRCDVPIIDRLIGLNCWVLDKPAINGVIRKYYEDFIVEEILPDGTILDLSNPVLKFSGLEGLFTHFILIKKGISNFDAIITIADKLGIPLSYFFYSGNKDKDAVTVQRVAVWGVPPETLMHLDLPPNLEIRSPIRELRRINIGDHKGNCFTILIRDIDQINNELLAEIIKELRQKKLLNYFGYQRFGIIRPITHIVGKLLLLRRYKEAILIYLTAPSLISDEKLTEIREEILNGEYKSALKKFPKKSLQYEWEITRNIIRFKEDWIKVLKHVPSFLLRIFAEAYQGYLFNRLISKILYESNEYSVNNSETRLIPLIGYEINQSRNLPDYISNAIREMLIDEGIETHFFKNRYFPPLSLRGGKRPMFLKPNFKEITTLKQTENKLILKLRFCLGKGQYATIVIREILKQNIIYSQLKQKYQLTDLNLLKRNLNNFIEFLRKMGIDLAV